MARIPTRFHGPAALSNAATTKYTVATGPPAEKVVIRHIHVDNTTASLVLFTMSIGADAAGTRIFDGYQINAGTPFDHFCYYVLDGGEVIQAFGSVNNQLVLTIDGDRIVLG